MSDLFCRSLLSVALKLSESFCKSEDIASNVSSALVSCRRNKTEMNITFILKKRFSHYPHEDENTWLLLLVVCVLLS